MYVPPTEIVGGCMDGAKAISVFDLNLLPVCSRFSNIQRLYWNARPPYAKDMATTSQLQLRGVVDGRVVELVLLSEPPAGATSAALPADTLLAS